MMDITPIPAFNDNYIWMITHPGMNKAIVVDPGDAKPVLEALAQHDLTLEAILITHHHFDHAGGITGLKTALPNVAVYGPIDSRIQDDITHPVKEGDHVKFPNFGLDFVVMEVPAHTKSHIAYYGNGMVFTGDTLFSAGCGRLFEGTAEQMYNALQRFAKLPPETAVYCGHEYTVSNLAFAKAADPDNPTIDEYKDQALSKREAGEATLPSTIGLERNVNPFMRSEEPALKATAEKAFGDQLADPIAVLGALRKWKDGGGF